MRANVESGNALRDAWRTMTRHKGKAGLFFVVTMTLAVLGIMRCPRTYVSQSTLFVRLGRESVTLDPTATTGQNIQKTEPRESEITSIKDMLQSRSLFERVVDRIGADEILRETDTDTDKEPSDGDSPSLLSGLRATLADLNLADPISTRESAVIQLMSSFHVGSTKQSNVIRLTFEARSPELAQKIMRAYLDTYRDQHAHVHRTPGSFDFFEEQEELLQQKLAKATQQLRDEKTKSHLVSIDGQQKVLQTQMELVETELLKRRNELLASQTRVKELREKLTRQPKRVETERVSGRPNNAADEMRSQLYELEIEERDFSSKFTDLHPRLIAIREQIADARKIVEAQPRERIESTENVNPTHEKIEIELVLEESAAASLQARMDSLTAQRSEIQDKVRALNDSERRIADLERIVGMLELSRQKYFENLEQARIDHELEVKRISNVSFVDEATFVAKPVSPKKMLILALGLFLACSGSVGIALLCEYLDDSFRTAEEVENTLDIPVLVSIPRNNRQSLSLN